MAQATDTDIQELKMAIDNIAKATDANTKAIEANARAIEANAKIIDTLVKATEANAKAIADLSQEMRLGFANMETKFEEVKGEIKTTNIKLDERTKAIETKLDERGKAVEILQKRLDTNEATRSRLIAGLIGAVFATSVTLITQRIIPPEPPRNSPNRGVTNYNLTTIASY
jgi:chromosome segregation ATPase